MGSPQASYKQILIEQEEIISSIKNQVARLLATEDPSTQLLKERLETLRDAWGKCRLYHAFLISEGDDEDAEYNSKDYFNTQTAHEEALDFILERLLEDKLPEASVNDTRYSFEALQASAQYLLDRVNIRPKIGIICGSGMSSIADVLTEKQIFPYQDIPNFPVSTVKSHVGQMVFGYLNGVPIMGMQGRFHYYEGYPLWKCAMPVRVMKLVGVTHLIVTNAAGGLNPNYKIGDIMLVKDHMNLMGFAGNNPLQGPNDDRFGPRFPPMNKAYSTTLLNIGKSVADEMGISDIIHEGVYACLGGPNFETVAELKMLSMVGVDAVGMSTVYEVIAARHCEMKVFCFSLVTNQCRTDYESNCEANHEEVLNVGRNSQSVLQGFVSRMVVYLKNLLDLEV